MKPGRIWLPLEATFPANDKVGNVGEDFGAIGPWAQIVLMCNAKVRGQQGRVEMTWRGFKRAIYSHDSEQAKEVLAALTEQELVRGISANEVGFEIHVAAWDEWNAGHAALRQQKARTARDTPQPSVTECDAVTPIEERRGEEKAKSTAEPDGIGVVRDLFAYWQQRCNHRSAKLTSDRKGKIQARLREGYSQEQIRKAIDGAAKAPFINDAGKRFDDIELICRNGSKLEGFITRADMLPAKVANAAAYGGEGACVDCGTDGQLTQGRCSRCLERWEDEHLNGGAA